MFFEKIQKITNVKSYREEFDKKFDKLRHLR